MTFCYMPHVISYDFKLSSSSLSDSLVLLPPGCNSTRFPSAEHCLPLLSRYC